MSYRAVGDVPEFGHAMKSQFLYDPKYTNLNHGSFGGYPVPVRNAVRGYHKLTEAAPDKFMRYQYIDLLDKSRERVAQLLQVPTDECVFVQNATSGVNTILRNIVYQQKDAIIYFDTIYGACEKTLLSIQETNPHIHLRKVGHGQDYGFSLPCTHNEIINAFSQTISRLIYEGYTPRVAVFDTIVSVPGVRLPFERITKMCAEYGILSVIDAAHAIGHIPLDLGTLNADFFVSNCHKWLYTPRGCAIMHVPARNHHLIRTTFPTSHGYKPRADPNSVAKPRDVLPPTTKSDFVNLFQYVATIDSTPYYCVPAALNFRANMCGGETAIYNYIRDIAQRGADLLAMELGTEVMDDMDPGQGLKALGSYEAASELRRPSLGGRDAGSKNRWAGGLRDCAMANVLLPITIAGIAHSNGSLRLGPGGAGSAGGLSPGLRKTSAGSGVHSRSSSRSSSRAPSMLAPQPTSWSQGTIKDKRPLNLTTNLDIPRTGSPVSFNTGSPFAQSPLHETSCVIDESDVSLVRTWMERTLVDEFNTFVPIFEYGGKIWTRISGQIYLEMKDFEWIGGVLRGLVGRVAAGEYLPPDRRAAQDAEQVTLWENELARKSAQDQGRETPDVEALGRRMSQMTDIGTPFDESGGPVYRMISRQWTAEPDTIRAETSRPDSARPETAVPETIREEPAKAEQAMPETAQPEVVKAEEAKPEKAVDTRRWSDDAGWGHAV